VSARVLVRMINSSLV